VFSKRNTVQVRDGPAAVTPPFY